MAPTSDEAIAKVQAAIETAQAAAVALADAVGDLPAKAASNLPSTDQANAAISTATDQANAAIATATDHLTKGAASLSAAAKVAADKAGAAIPKP